MLKPGLPDRSKKDESQKLPPQLTVLSSGDVVPFELHIERDGAPALWRMTSLADGDLRIEQRKDERDWVHGRADQAAARRRPEQGAYFRCAPLNEFSAAPAQPRRASRIPAHWLHAHRSDRGAGGHRAGHARRHPGCQPDCQQQRLPARQDDRALGRDEPPHRAAPAESCAGHRQDLRRSRDGGPALEVDDGRARRRRSRRSVASTSACGPPMPRRAARSRR